MSAHRFGVFSDLSKQEYARLQGAIGLARPRWHWQDFVNVPSCLPTVGTDGTSTETAVIGAFRMTTGAGGGSYREYFGGGVYPTFNTIQVPGGAAGRWGYVVRFRLTTAIDAAALLYAGFRDSGGGNYMRVGGIGPVTSVNFSLQVNTAGGNIDSGVAVDTNWHTARIIRASNITEFYLDDVLRGLDADSYPGANVGWHIQVNSGATPAARGMEYAYTGILYPEV